MALCLIKACKNWPGQIVRTAVLKCSKKKAVLKFLGKHEWPETILSYTGIQFAAWNITEEKFHQRYFPATYLKLLKTSIIPHGTTVISCQLSFHVYCAAIPCLYK